MKQILLLFLIFNFSHCSFNSLKSSSISESSLRDIASERFELKTFLDDLNEGLRVFPKLGNPRFYLFEHLVDRAKSLTLNLNDQSDLSKFLSIWASYKVMTEAGIYLNYSFLVNKDSEGVIKILEKIDSKMSDLKIRLNHVVKIEDEELALSQERILLIQSLGKRISRDFKLFVKNERDQLFVKSFLNSLNRLNSQDLQTQYLQITSDPKYKKTKRLLSNLSLQDNGNIDGLDESLEKVMSVQMSSELIHWLFERELRN